MYSTLWSAFVKFESVVGDSYSLTHLEADIVHLNSDCKALLVWWPVIGWKFGTKAETIHLKSDMLHSTRKRCIDLQNYRPTYLCVDKTLLLIHQVLLLLQLLCLFGDILRWTKKKERTKICICGIVLFVNKKLKIVQFFCQSCRMKLLLRNHIFN